tara:strand:+ start:933 stop:1358 length:426 start_codon:yes stop_codon:yes gene_type:complete
MSKKFYGFLDIVCTPIVTQGLQTKIIKNALEDNNLELSFYTTESHTTFKNMSILKQKLSEKNNFKGFAFFSVLQFAYKDKFDLSLLNKIIKKYNCLFVRENIFIKNINDLKSLEKELILFPTTNYMLINNLKENFLSITKK